MKGGKKIGEFFSIPHYMIELLTKREITHCSFWQDDDEIYTVKNVKVTSFSSYFQIEGEVKNIGKIVWTIPYSNVTNIKAWFEDIDEDWLLSVFSDDVEFMFKLKKVGDE